MHAHARARTHAHAHARHTHTHARVPPCATVALARRRLRHNHVSTLAPPALIIVAVVAATAAACGQHQHLWLQHYNKKSSEAFGRASARWSGTGRDGRRRRWQGRLRKLLKGQTGTDSEKEEATHLSVDVRQLKTLVLVVCGVWQGALPATPSGWGPEGALPPTPTGWG